MRSKKGIRSANWTQIDGIQWIEKVQKPAETSIFTTSFSKALVLQSVCGWVGPLLDQFWLMPMSIISYHIIMSIMIYNYLVKICSNTQATVQWSRWPSDVRKPETWWKPDEKLKNGVPGGSSANGGREDVETMPWSVRRCAECGFFHGGFFQVPPMLFLSS